ncbi:MAG TPA: protein-disulfide reductase DsbD domain-containing protein, partial [Ramlibacter sp.]|nr:protein-disulfide reductase DsbD domain-containing protein [Ramlibacter sp.]
MSSLRLFSAWLALALFGLAGTALAADSSVVTTERARAELLAHAPDGVAPGKTVWAGLQIVHQPQWHTYWKNSGDSGLPTKLQWTLPPGVQAGEIAWPLPKKIPIGTLANYGYDGTLLLPVHLTITPEFKPPLFGSVELKLQAQWLICRKECIPEEGSFVLQLPVQSTTALHAAAFDAAFAAQPRPVLQGTAGAIPDSQARIEGSMLHIAVQGLPVTLRGKTLEFFPETAEVIETAARWSQAWNGSVWTAQVPLSPQRSASPGVMPVVLAADGQGWRAELPVQGSWPATAAPAGVPAALQAALNQNASSSAPATAPLGLAAALLGALLG